MLLVNNLKFERSGKVIFENIHITASQGKIVFIKGNNATIEGPTEFIGAELMSSDLRASVSLILAALSAKGKTTINRIYHLDRGYEQIEKKLRKLGANIRRVS